MKVVPEIARARRSGRKGRDAVSLVRGSSLVRGACIGAAMGLVAGCSGGKLGSFDTPESSKSSNKLAALFGLDKKDGAAPPGPRVSCPEITVLQGTEVARFHSGDPPSNETLRVQYSIEDMARECSVEGGKLFLKVGVSGKVLLGPVGSAGNFSVPVRVAVVRIGDQVPVASKLYRAAATIPARATEESFSIVTEPILVPLQDGLGVEDYLIKVGIDSTGVSADEKRPRR